MAKLGDIATIQSGGTPARSIAEYWEDGTIPWVKISDIKSKHLNQTEEMITEAGLENSSAKIFPKGTILYTIFATLGETSILEINAATNQAIAGISITDSRVLPDYLYYYLLSQKIHVQKIGRGVAQNNINMKLLRDFDVPLPSKEAQLNIIEQLNRVTELLFLRKQQLTKLDELIKARFVEMFGNAETTSQAQTKRLEECCISISGGNTPSMQHPEYYGGKIPFIKSGDVKSDHISVSSLTLTQIALNETTVKMLPKGTLIVVIRSAALLKEFRIGILDVDAVINQDLKALQTSDDVLPVYLMWAIKMKSQVLLSRVQTMLTSHIRMEDLLDLKVQIPPLSLQNQFAAFVEEVDKSKVEVQKALDQTQLLFDSLMQQYFG